MLPTVCLGRFRKIPWQRMLTLCIAGAVVCLLIRGHDSVGKQSPNTFRSVSQEEVKALKITSERPEVGTTVNANASSEITILPTTSTAVLHQKAVAKEWASKRFHAMSSPILRYLSIAHNNVDVWDNLHQYKFSMNSDNCKGWASIVVIVHTALYNVKKRQKIRNTTSVCDTKHGSVLTVVFLVGQTNNASLQTEVAKESQKYQDMVQGNFIDSYHNLTHKHIMGYHWVLTHCKNVKYVIKMDDDVVLHTNNVLRYLLSNPVSEGNIMCFVVPGSRKSTAGKWAVSEVEYPFVRYPPYCAGFAYMTTLSVIRNLHAASTYIKSIWIDDAYATGILALASNTKLIKFPDGQYFNGLSKPPERYKTEGMFVLYRD
ncbi:beta-1,3-galactosyltransferase 1-like isoform X1 [Haliotis rufescens]|uniref:beta-1,3-galactosyltransferase 1-like isoform X1 n=2 Tax=Haliotis rufescens TaxID=6454 RepID=UPI001EB03196|nr:beta-1,3-galactosyltransferase 1-like isoform X1 [Haliotis rufescens]